MSWSRREQIFPDLTAFLSEREYIIRSESFRNWRKKSQHSLLTFAIWSRLQARETVAAPVVHVQVWAEATSRNVYTSLRSHIPTHILAPENVIPESLSSTSSSPHAALMSRSLHICSFARAFNFISFQSWWKYILRDFSMCFVLEHFLENTLILSTYIWYTWCLILYQLW